MDNPNPLLLVLPEDLERQKQLRAKLEEYGKRLAENPQPDALNFHLRCKAIILQRLIRDGSVDIAALPLELSHDEGFNVSHLKDAWGVIEDYCTTGGVNVHSGTGLPSVS